MLTCDDYQEYSYYISNNYNNTFKIWKEKSVILEGEAIYLWADDDYFVTIDENDIAIIYDFEGSVLFCEFDVKQILAIDDYFISVTINGELIISEFNNVYKIAVIDKKILILTYNYELWELNIQTLILNKIGDNFNEMVSNQHYIVLINNKNYLYYYHDNRLN